MNERAGLVTSHGSPLILLGPALKAGDTAPDFKALDKELNETGLGDFKGRIKLISVTPSLDTPVCDIQARTFNKEAASLPDDVSVINISMDLPFAISRFCTSAGIDRVIALSDHRFASFGSAYGVIIKELRLLARSIFVIDKDDIIRYIEIVPVLSDHPNYERAIQEVKKLI